MLTKTKRAPSHRGHTFFDGGCDTISFVVTLLRGALRLLPPSLLMYLSLEREERALTKMFHALVQHRMVAATRPHRAIGYIVMVKDVQNKLCALFTSIVQRPPVRRNP